VESLDRVKYIRLGHVERWVLGAVYSLSFEHPEESFTSSIIATMTDTAHAADESAMLQKPLIVTAGELTAAIRMQNHWPVTLALPRRHFNCTNDPVTILSVVHGPPSPAC